MVHCHAVRTMPQERPYRSYRPRQLLTINDQQFPTTNQDQIR